MVHKTQAHTEWEKQKKDYEVFKSNANNEYLVKKAELDKIIKEQADYIEQRTNEILNESIKQWKQERDNYYDQLRNGLQDILSGDKDYVITAVNDLFPNDDLDMEYFVDIAYDEPNGRMLVDLDLPDFQHFTENKRNRSFGIYAAKERKLCPCHRPIHFSCNFRQGNFFSN